MKKTLKLLLSMITSGSLCLVVGWWYIIHYARTTGLTEQNVDSFMWSVIVAGILATIGLTTAFYRAVR